MRNILIFLVAAAFLNGCVAIKNTKDNKALSRVYASRDLSDKAYAVLALQHPVKVDTVFKFIKGEPVISYDTVERPVTYFDTIINEKPQIVKVVTKIVTKYSKSIDTVFKIIRDERQLNVANTRITVLETELRASKDSDSKHTKGKRNWMLASIGIGILLLLGIVLVFKNKI